MNLPKFTPGQVVIIGSSDSNYREVVQVRSAYANYVSKSEISWTYRHADGSFREDVVKHILNGGFWLPASEYNPPVVPDRVLDTTLFDKMMEVDPDEQAWLDQNVRGKEEELRKASGRWASKDWADSTIPKKIEVTNG
jgi:hypothetical protein